MFAQTDRGGQYLLKPGRNTEKYRCSFTCRRQTVLPCFFSLSISAKELLFAEMPGVLSASLTFLFLFGKTNVIFTFSFFNASLSMKTAKNKMGFDEQNPFYTLCCYFTSAPRISRLTLPSSWQSTRCSRPDGPHVA